MSKCDVVIEFDRPDRTFTAGEAVSGKVHVTANKDVASDGVKVKAVWQTHGRGNRAGGEVDEVTFRGEQLRAGDRKTYEFSFDAPAGPLTYHGHYLNVDQYIHASVDIPWAIDPKAKEEYILEPDPAGETHDSDPGVTCTGASSKGHKFALLVTLIIATVASIAVPPYGALAWLIVVPVLFTLVRNFMALRKLGSVSFDLAQSYVSPGQSVPLTLECCPSGRPGINGIAATLKAQEIVVSGSGTNRSTHTKTVVEEQCVIREAMHLDMGLQTIEAAVTIPETAAWTFHASDNDLKWTLTVRVDIPGWPDWVGQVDIDLVPGPATTSA